MTGVGIVTCWKPVMAVAVRPTWALPLILRGACGSTMANSVAVHGQQKGDAGRGAFWSAVSPMNGPRCGLNGAGNG